MKINLTLFAVLTSVIVFAQKKELKLAKNAFTILQYNKVNTNLNKVKPLLKNLKPAEQSLYYLLRGKTIAVTNKEGDLKRYKNAINAFNKVIETESKANIFRNRKEAKAGKIEIAGKIEESAIKAQQEKSYDKATEIYQYLYNSNKKDTIQLFKAAANAVNNKNYDLALKHYNKLAKLGFTGIAPVYQATNVATGKVDVISSKKDMDQLVEQRRYAHPKTSLSKSKKGEITKNIALIHYSRGDIAKAEAAFVKAKADNPNDSYIKEVESQMFVSLANDLSKSGDNEKAIERYKKALALTPKNVVINQNIAAILIAKDQDFVAKMNTLTRSKADRVIYKEYEAKRKANFTEASKYLEAYLAVKENKNIASSLLQIYTNIQSPKAAALKAKYGL